MGMPKRFVHLMFHIDTNRINARRALENMNRLEKWHKDGVIALEMSKPSMEEAFAGGNRDRKKKASGYIFSQTYADTPDEKKLLERISTILFPQGAKDQNQRKDVEIVFNATKYRRVLVTNDGGSKSQPGGNLGNADQLRKEVGVKVVTDAQAIDMVKREIAKRDNRARHISKSRAIDLPDWVGMD